MSTKAGAEVLPGMYNTQHSLGADSLHCLGQTSLQVSSSLTHCLRIISNACLLSLLLTVKPRLYDTTGCTTGLTSGCVV